MQPETTLVARITWEHYSFLGSVNCSQTSLKEAAFAGMAKGEPKLAASCLFDAGRKITIAKQ